LKSDIEQRRRRRKIPENDLHKYDIAHTTILWLAVEFPHWIPDPVLDVIIEP
jgi:hypothetical protein